MKTFALLFLLSITTVISAQTGEKNFIDQNYIEVSGKAEMQIVPNQIYLKIVLSEKDTKNKISVQDLEKQMLQKLQEIGVDITKNVLIEDMTSNFKSFMLGQKDILLSKQYQVIVKDGKTAGRVFVELEKIGISNVSVAKLDNDQMDQYRQEVKINAIKAAKSKAEALTAAIGQSIGKAIFIQEPDRLLASTRYENTMNIHKMINVETTSDSNVEFEKIQIEYTILCRFELK